jgi:hypothetical protein
MLYGEKVAYKIEHNIPFSGRSRSAELKETLAAMKPGDSFLINEETAAKLESARSTCRLISRKLKVKTATRLLSPTSLRVWVTQINQD